MAESPSSSAYHRVRSIKVTGGFLDSLHMEFGDSLNCIIGGRGTGKTTVLELVRWALEQMPDPRDSQPLHKIIDKLIQANLGSGQVELEVETLSGIRYGVRRSYGDDALVLSETGEPVAIQIGKGNIFSADIYSQNQIEEIANDPLFQLKLVDKFVTEKIAGINGEIHACVGELHANAGEIVKLRTEIGLLKEKITQLPEIVEKLKALKKEGSDEEAKALLAESEFKAIRDQEKRILDQLQELLSATTGRLREAIAQVPGQVGELLNEGILEGRNSALLRQVKALVDGGVREIGRKADEAARLAETTREKIREKADELAAVHLKQEKTYQELLEKGEKEKGKAKERDALMRRQSELLEEQKKLEKRREELGKRDMARAGLLRRLSDMTDARYRLRAEVAESLTSQLAPTIRVLIEQYGNTDSYRDLLMEAMKGSGFKYAQVVDRLVQRVPPHEFAAIVQRGDVQALRDHLELDADRANRIVLQLKDSKTVFDIEVVELHDRPTIELKDGADYKDSTALSTGQKCTTILPILLLESASPLLIDQPEDNLDNAFIYETVVKSLRGVRGRRQLVFVTHNPNIPVLGDAQRVFVLQSTGRRASLKASGSVDDVKAEIETILEGGKEAFQRRKARYGY